jgi:hypothetical protein
MRRPLLHALLVLALAAPLGGRALAADKKEKTSYVELPAVAATILRSSGHRGVITVELGLDVPDAGLRDKAMLSGPLLRDAYAEALQPYAAGLSPGAPPNADYIEMALQHETDRVLGRRGARLLLGSIIIN